MADFDINAHLARQGGGFAGGGGAGSSEGVKVNEDEIFALIPEGAEKTIWNTAKIAMALPVVGWLIEMLMPFNAGKSGLDAGMNSEGLAGKQIRPGGGGPQGGFLAKIAGELMKNSAITDHTAGVGGGGGEGSGGGSGDSGGGGSSSFADSGGSHSFDSAFAGMEGPIIAAGGGNRFDYSDIPRDFLGTFSSPSTPYVEGRGMGVGMGMG